MVIGAGVKLPCPTALMAATSKVYVVSWSKFGTVYEVAAVGVCTLVLA
jgi:hypothetical protein